MKNFNFDGIGGFHCIDSVTASASGCGIWSKEVALSASKGRRQDILTASIAGSASTIPRS